MQVSIGYPPNYTATLVSYDIFNPLDPELQGITSSKTNILVSRTKGLKVV